ncbi:adenosylmethionine decarboxylase [Pseudomonadota bacterium]
MKNQKEVGTHIIVDISNCYKNLDNQQYIEDLLVKMANAGNATVLNKKFHKFSGYGGVTGILVLSESHISIHTWPELNFAAVDIFMCGKSNPRKSVEIIKEVFVGAKLNILEIKRIPSS